jgi:5-methylcytosine-specific restriction enzyme subunit McrC
MPASLGTLAAPLGAAGTASGFDDAEVSWTLPQRRVLKCNEWEDLKIDADELVVGGRFQLYDGISASKYLRTRISGDKIIFSATHYVGHIPLNDHIALNVVPRFSVSNLTRLLRIADHSPIALERYVRSYMATHEPLPSIFEDLAAAFAQAVAEVVHEGLFATYSQREQNTSFPSGRVLITPTVRKYHARGVRHRVRATWHERTYDNAQNRLLKYTIWILIQRLSAVVQRKGMVRLRSELSRYYCAFTKVRLDRSRSFLRSSAVSDSTRLPAVRSYYAQAIELAQLLVRDNSLDLATHQGSVMAPSLLVDMQAAFEAYLRNSIMLQFARIGSAYSVLDGNQGAPAGARKKLFDEPDSDNATPDIVLCEEGGAGISKNDVPLLVEVKYKPRPDRSDINQAMAYALTYRCQRVVLAHATNGPISAGGMHKIGSIDNTVFFRYAFNLTANLEVEEQHFAEAIAQLVHPQLNSGVRSAAAEQ